MVKVQNLHPSEISMLKGDQKMKKFHLVIVMAFICSVFAAGTLSAQNQQGSTQQPGMGYGMPNFTPEQMAQMRQQMLKNIPPVQLFQPLTQQTLERIAPALGLSAAQLASADQLFTDLTKKLQTISGKTDYKQSLLDEMRSQNPDQQKVNALADALAKQENEILKAELQTWIEFQKLLTEDQKTALWNMMPVQMGMMGQRMNRQGGTRGDRQGRQGGGLRNRTDRTNQQEDTQQ